MIVSTPAALLYDNGHNLIEDGVSVADGGCLDNATSLERRSVAGTVGDYGSDSSASAGTGYKPMRLLPNSPAINAGDDAACPTTDQRGGRGLATCDIGAFESQGFVLTITGGDDQTALVDSAVCRAVASDRQCQRSKSEHRR